jgi:hypothetical protein
MKRAATVHYCLAAEHPTEADARAELPDVPADTPYLGLWKVPLPERPVVHVLSAGVTADELKRLGWVRA